MSEPTTTPKRPRGRPAGTTGAYKPEEERRVKSPFCMRPREWAWIKAHKQYIEDEARS